MEEKHTNTNDSKGNGDEENATSDVAHEKNMKGILDQKDDESTEKPNHDNTTSTKRNDVVPKMGPEPILLSRKEIDGLYEMFQILINALSTLNVPWIVTGGSLLGTIRQHSILFCDDDIDVAILETGKVGSDTNTSTTNNNIYETIVRPNLQSLLGDEYIYQIRPWEGGDRVRPKKINTIFIDLFVIRQYQTVDELRNVIGYKKNGQLQSNEYVQKILTKIENCSKNIPVLPVPTQKQQQQQQDQQSLSLSLYPIWHFSTRKAIEMWTKEVYRTWELFPLSYTNKMGPIVNIPGPRMPITLLQRAFGTDCFTVYYQSISHKGPKQNPKQKQKKKQNNSRDTNDIDDDKDNNESKELPPLISVGGTWEGNPKVPLQDEHYIPIQPVARVKRRPTLHCKATLQEYLSKQSILEYQWIKAQQLIEEEQEQEQMQHKQEPTKKSSDAVTSCNDNDKNVNDDIIPNRTIYMDGVFDLFHIGHLNAIQQCAKLGTTVIIGVTGDDDAQGYKRLPIVPQNERVAIIQSLSIVNLVICPCPLIVTEQFMNKYNIDLVVHGFANPEDATKQYEFFKIPIRLNKFYEISYYHGLSTTERIQKIQNQQERDEAQEQEEQGTEQEEQDYDNNTKRLQKSTTTTTKPQWFGSTVAQMTNCSSVIPIDPFPLDLRMAIEVHIRKATKRRKEALDAIRQATGPERYDAILSSFFNKHISKSISTTMTTTMTTYKLMTYGSLATEGDCFFDTRLYPLREALLQSLQLSDTFDLSRIHEVEGMKDKLLHTLVTGTMKDGTSTTTTGQSSSSFQHAYDEFVRQVCVPIVASIYDSYHAGGINGNDDRKYTSTTTNANTNTNTTNTNTTKRKSTSSCDEIYYQAFPCIRIIQPREFSIGPHADVAYGHHPCSINFYVPLTQIDGSSSLFLESRPGSEDWHPIQGNYGTIKHFAGATCLHWTTDNMTDYTRVSLDFRVIVGSMFHELKDGSSQPGGQIDVYRKTSGYYSRCTKQTNESQDRLNNTGSSSSSGSINDDTTEDIADMSSVWKRDGPLLRPDARVGFPWTVKDWDKFFRKHLQNKNKAK